MGLVHDFQKPMFYRMQGCTVSAPPPTLPLTGSALRDLLACDVLRVPPPLVARETLQEELAGGRLSAARCGGLMVLVEPQPGGMVRGEKYA